MLNARTPGYTRSLGRLAIALMVAMLLAGCGVIHTGGELTAARTSSSGLAFTGELAQSIVDEPDLAPLVPPDLDLRAGPLDVPLVLRIPSIQVDSAVLGVGITPNNVMDAPTGTADDPVWQKAFWYRGSGVPGEMGTATIAGHVDDILGRPAIFARLQELEPGDLIVIHDARTGDDIHFTVDETATYSLEQTTEPSVLARIYGIGPVSGFAPQPSPDGLAHLTLITCRWDYSSGGYDQRTVVFASRSNAEIGSE